MSSSSLKNVVKVLNTTFSAPTVPHPPPEALQQTIEAFLERYQDIDDHDSQRLQDELLTLYKKYVTSSPDKHSPFLSALRQLRPAIKGENRLAEWWSLVIRPTVDAIGHKRDAIEEASGFLLSILVFDAEEDKDGEKARLSERFTKRLLDAYLARTSIPSNEEGAVLPEDDFIAHELETILIAFGRKKIKEFLLAIDGLFTQKEHRAQALGLLCTFVRAQPPHLYLVLETPLIQHLQKCLLIDTSSTVVDLALTILIMFLPHITSSLVANLPKLFLIYSRILCWDRYGKDGTEGPKTSEDDESTPPPATKEVDEFESDPNWAKLHHSFENAESSPPRADYLFTFLYGLFPLNFVSFIRKPRKYLKSTEFPGADDLDFDQEMIRSRSEQHRHAHILHPSFLTATPEDELADNRWLKSDPADLVTECMELCVASPDSLQYPGPPPTAKLPDIPEMFVRTEDIPADRLLSNDDQAMSTDLPSSPTDTKSNSSWRNTYSTTLTTSTSNWQMEPPNIPRKPSVTSQSHPAPKSSRATSPAPKALTTGSDSPTLPPHGAQSAPYAKDLDNTKDLGDPPRKASVASARSNATTSPRLEDFAQTLSYSQFPMPPKRVSIQRPNISSLQREVMLLRSDLNFERYLKQQHLSHIGQLQRKHIREATVEAETQNLINSNKALKAKLIRANELYNQLKNQTATSRNQSKKWESELSSKIRAYREEEQQWKSEGQALRLDLERLKKDSEHFKRLVVESEARQLLSQQKLRSLELDLEELENLRKEVERLQERLRGYELRELEFEQAKEDREILRTELQMAKLQLNSRDGDRERCRRSYNQKIAELESELQSRQPIPNQYGQLPPSVQQIIDSAIAASQSKMNQLKKSYARLLHKCTELEIKCAELEGEQDVKAHRVGSHSNLLGLSPVTDGFSSPTFSREGSTGGANSVSGAGGPRGAHPFHRAHAFSDPAAFDDDDEYAHEYEKHYSSSTNNAGSSSSFPGRPVRFKSLQNRQTQSHPLSVPVDFAPTHERDLQPQTPHDTLRSSNKSAFSMQSSSSKSDKAKEKIEPKSEVRVYGRGKAPPVRVAEYETDRLGIIGGAQNIGKKADKSDKKDKQAKTGGFRGLRGVM